MYYLLVLPKDEEFWLVMLKVYLWNFCATPIERVRLEVSQQVDIKLLSYGQLYLS